MLPRRNPQQLSDIDKLDNISTQCTRTAACVVSLVDRLVHNAEIVAIEGESYRLKEARDRADARARKRRSTKP